MSQWQSLCLALVVSLTSASTASPQASTGGVEIQSGDVWLLPDHRVSAIVIPQAFPVGALPIGDVWLSPDHQTIPFVTVEKVHPGDATLATSNEARPNR